MLALAVLAVLAAAPVAAQCTAVPGTEDFETTLPTSTATCNNMTITYPAGWSLDPASTNSWNPDFGGTGSTGTGPAVDSNPGTSAGIYLYTETSGCGVGTTAILNSPIYDVSSLGSPCAIFDYHMWGATMGTLAVESFDGTSWNQVFSLSGDQGDQWFTQIVPLFTFDAGGGCTQAARFRFLGTSGSSFTSDMAIDNVTVAQCPVQEWELNDSTMSFDVDGVQTDGFFNAAVVSKTAYLCGGMSANPVPATFNLSSTLPGAGYDVVLSSNPVVGATGGGIPLPDGQIVNVNLLGGFSFLGGGTVLVLPGSGVPGATSVSISTTALLNTASTTSMQAVVFGGASFLGFTLSQAVQLDVAVSNALPSVPGPTTGTTNVVVDITAEPTCWTASGMPFYGTTFSQIAVSPNGFVGFGGTDTDTTASILDAQSDLVGRVGFWTALAPDESGNIVISNPAPDLVRVDWNAVFYDVGGPAITFFIELDCLTGQITVGGLGGLVPNPNTTSTLDDQWLGISAGATLGATDPGAALFGLGANGSGGPLDSLYEFNDVSVTLTGLPASVVGGMQTLTFVPQGLGGYNWLGS